MEGIPENMLTWTEKDIRKEAWRLLFSDRGYRELFMPFIWPLFLPLTLIHVSLVEVYLQSFFFAVAWLQNDLPYRGIFSDPRDHSQTSKAMNEERKDLRMPTILAYFLILGPLVSGLLEVFATAATAKIVAYIYSTTPADRNIVHNVYRELPSAFKRAFQTHSYSYIINGSIFFGALILIGFLFNYFHVPYLPAIFLLFAFFVARYLMNSTLILAPSLSALEPDQYGREALKQSIVFMKDSKGIASSSYTFLNFKLVAFISFVALSLHFIIERLGLACGLHLPPIWVITVLSVEVYYLPLYMCSSVFVEVLYTFCKLCRDHETSTASIDQHSVRDARDTHAAELEEQESLPGNHQGTGASSTGEQSTSRRESEDVSQPLLTGALGGNRPRPVEPWRKWWRSLGTRMPYFRGSDVTADVDLAATDIV